MRFYTLCLYLLAIMTHAACTWNQQDDILTPCGSNPPLGDLQSDYHDILLHRYYWNMGEGVVIDSAIPLNVKFTFVGDSSIGLVVSTFDMGLKLSFTSAERMTFSSPPPSPHHWYYVRFNCLTDTCEIDFKRGALGFDDRVKGKFKFR